MGEKVITAAIVVIGDEILSGRTKDRNIGHIADILTSIGIDLKEVRIVSDDSAVIGQAVNALRQQYTYVFTSGGIGPTHDDITADAVAAAFGLECDYHPDAYALLERHYAAAEMPFTDARKRMARTPVGATLIDNPVSKAPGFRVENVFVMAGVPKIMQAMLDNIVPQLESGRTLLSRTLPCAHGEGTIGGPLGEIQARHPDVMIGSYPKFDEGNFSTDIVVRSRSQEHLNAAATDIETMLAEISVKRSTVQR